MFIEYFVLEPAWGPLPMRLHFALSLCPSRPLLSMLLIPFDPAVPEEEECELVAVAMSHCAVALQDSNKTVALLGAGVSTSAGVRVSLLDMHCSPPYDN